MKRPFATRRFAPVLVSALVIVTTAGTVGHAQDGRGFLEQLFGIPAQPAAPVYRAPDLDGRYGYGDPGYRRHTRRERPRARYAALPKADDEAKLTGKQPVDQKAIADNPTKAILEDKTLRPGDIVVLPGGPRVYTGGSDKRHRMSDFEDVKHSHLIDRRTRQQLLAMMVPVGAMPADQARKVAAQKRRLARPDEIAQVEAATLSVARNEAGTRVINPWSQAR